MLIRIVAIAFYSVMVVFSSSSFALVVTENKPVNCSEVIKYFGNVSDYTGANLTNLLPSSSMIQPWNTWKGNSVNDVVSIYGSFFRINSVNIPEELPFKFYLQSWNSSNQVLPGQIAQSQIQTWTMGPGNSAPSISFDQSNGVKLAFQQIPGSYIPGTIYSGSINMSIFSGVFYVPNSYSLTQAVNELMSSGAPTTCNVPITIQIFNSCKIEAQPVSFGNVTTADIQNGKTNATSIVSASCLLNDSVTMSLSGGTSDAEGNILINMGSNLQTKLTLVDGSGAIITNSTPLKVQGGVAMNSKLNASLNVIDDTKPIPASDVSGNAILTLTYN
ncbi:MAG: spore coat protein U domain-containing protein [Plesiomonas shigelloides]